MSRIKIDKVVERRLYAESMGRCMNPECRVELFINDGDMIEKAQLKHIAILKIMHLTTWLFYVPTVIQIMIKITCLPKRKYENGNELGWKKTKDSLAQSFRHSMS